MMHGRLDRAALGVGDGWLAVRMPYVDRALAMTVVLPDQGRPDALEALIVDGGLSSILSAPRPRPVELSLPRWTMRTELSLQETLARLGMPRAFDSTRADFSTMTVGKQQLSIDAVFHQVFVAVDEFGTEAAAATATAMRATSLPPAATPVTIDRPFIFVIHDVGPNTPYFLGRVIDPR
jgi:serpin B